MRTLVDSEVRTPGTHEASWDGRDDSGQAVASGVYFYRIEAASHVENRRMVLLR